MVMRHRHIRGAFMLPSRRDALAFCALVPAFSARAAAGYPSQAIRLIVPQPAGGGFDTVARILADRLAPRLGQAVVVENRQGAGTIVGTQAAAQATADGYTLLLGGLSNIALNPGLYPSLPYDPEKDFAPVGLAVSWSYTLIARKDLPQHDLAELIAFARANPGRVTYASAGRGSGQHIAAAVTEHLAGVRITHVPYRGAQAAYQDLMGGRVDLFFDISSTARAQVEAGTVRALAVSSRQRQPFHPDVPSVAETGIADLDMESWFGLFAPAATAPAILERLRRELAAVLVLPDVEAAFARTGGRVLRLGAEETRAQIRGDIERWTRLIRAAGLSEAAN